MERLMDERMAVINLGQEIGYGNMMELASEEWIRDLEVKYAGKSGGAFLVGPCKAFTVPCECDDPRDCDWCCLTGWLTKRVKQAKDEDDRKTEL